MSGEHWTPIQRCYLVLRWHSTLVLTIDTNAWTCASLIFSNIFWRILINTIPSWSKLVNFSEWYGKISHQFPGQIALWSIGTQYIQSSDAIMCKSWETVTGFSLGLLSFYHVPSIIGLVYDWFTGKIAGKPQSSWEINGKSVVSRRFSLFNRCI